MLPGILFKKDKVGCGIVSQAVAAGAFYNAGE